jgi:hypothetical protein
MELQSVHVTLKNPRFQITNVTLIFSKTSWPRSWPTNSALHSQEPENEILTLIFLKFQDLTEKDSFESRLTTDLKAIPDPNTRRKE